jgi:hypothetical protein
MYYTTIRVKDETKKRLQEHGRYKDSYDSIIERILDKIEAQK